MLDGIGNRYVPNLEGPRKPTSPVTPQPLSAPGPAPTPPSSPDRAAITPVRLAGYELAPAPFQTVTPLDAAAWHDLALATRQAGLGGLLDRVAAEAATRDPEGALGAPVLFNGPPGWRVAPRRTLEIARQLATAGWHDSARGVAALAAETADAADRPLHLAAAMLADRLGGRAEAAHVLFRLAERAESRGDAVATARRALAMGYPENAKFAYYRAATLAGGPQEALAIAVEAAAAGLRYEAGEPAFQHWRGHQERLWRELEGPPAGPDFASTSPYGPRALPRPAFLSPWLAAMRRAQADELGAIARAATLAGEGATAALAWRRLRESARES